MSFSNQLSPINIACNGHILQYNHCEDRFVPDVQVTAGDLSHSPTQSYYSGTKRTREDSGIWVEDLEEGFLGSLTPPESKRHCSPVSSVFPESPLTLEYTGINIPVTSTGGSSPIGSVDFLQPTAGCISQYSSSSSVFQPPQSFANTGNIGGGDIDQVFSMQHCETVVAGQSFSNDYRMVISEQPELVSYYESIKEISINVIIQ